MKRHGAEFKTYGSNDQHQTQGQQLGIHAVLRLHDGHKNFLQLQLPSRAINQRNPKEQKAASDTTQHKVFNCGFDALAVIAIHGDHAISGKTKEFKTQIDGQHIACADQNAQTEQKKKSQYKEFTAACQQT